MLTASLLKVEVKKVLKTTNLSAQFLNQSQNVKKLNRYWLKKYGRGPVLLSETVKKIRISSSISNRFIDLIFE